MFISHYNGHGIKLVRPLSIVDNTRDYACVSHSRQWSSNYNLFNRLRKRELAHDSRLCIHIADTYSTRHDKF